MESYPCELSYELLDYTNVKIFSGIYCIHAFFHLCDISHGYGRRSNGKSPFDSTNLQ